jgi:hypothetical protein
MGNVGIALVVGGMALLLGDLTVALSQKEGAAKGTV